MFIEQLDKTRLLITLEHEDLDVFDLEPYSISMENKETKSLFKQLLTLAAIKAGITIKDKVLSVEAMPYDFGCFLLVTIKPKSKRKMYRIKNHSSYLLAEFVNAAVLLNTIEALYNENLFHYNCDLYSGGGRFYLLFTSKAVLPNSLKLTLSEYGKILPCGSLTKSKLEEFCKPIHMSDTIEYIGERI